LKRHLASNFAELLLIFARWIAVKDIQYDPVTNANRNNIIYVFISGLL